MPNLALSFIKISSIVVFIVAHFFSSSVTLMALTLFSSSYSSAKNCVSTELALSLLVMTMQEGT